MQGIWLLTDLRCIRHSCSIWGGWVKRTKGLQKFRMLSFSGDGIRCEFLVFHLCLDSGLWRCIISNWQELNWSVGLFSVHMRMHEGKTNFPSYLQRFPPPTVWHQTLQQSSTSILGRKTVGHSWKTRARAGIKVTPIRGNISCGLRWVGGWAKVALGVDRLQGARVWVLYDLEACALDLAFQGAQHIEGAVQGHYATHPSYVHLFQVFTPVAKSWHMTQQPIRCAGVHTEP